MNVASPAQSAEDRQDWVALRAVAELAYLNGALQTSTYPLLRTAASCGYLRSTDTSVGLSHPLLFELSNLRSSEGVLHDAHRRTLVETLIEDVVLSASGRYPNLKTLGKAAKSPPAASVPPPPAAPSAQLVLSHPLPSASAARRYPSLAILGATTHPKQHLALTPFISECEAIAGSPFDAVGAGDDSDEELFTGASGEQSYLQPRNVAFLFTKPHAFGRYSQQLVESALSKRQFRIERCGVMSTDRIREEGLIDKHYAAIARYACEWDAAQIQLPPSAISTFSKTFGEDWSTCVSSGRVLNAVQAAARYKCANGIELAAVWGKNPKRTKLGPGLYAGYVSDDAHYILNGFYLANREKFTAPRGFINWYVVSWEEHQMPWSEFRGNFIGPTNPAEAPLDSLRGKFLAQWKDLGLAYAPTVSDNGVHASAGPLEGLAERLVWLPRHALAHDVFGRALMKRGVAPAFVQQLLANPEVTLPIGALGSSTPKKGLIFDLLEDTQTSDALEAIVRLQQDVLNRTPPGGFVSPFAILQQCVDHGTEVTPKYKAVSALLALSGFATQLASTPVAPLATTQAETVVAAAVLEEPAHGPSSLRPRPTYGRAVSSPYQYDRRNSGAGLERIFQFTIQHVSSRRYASKLSTEVSATIAVEASFFGLRALHAAVVSIKKEVAPDPYVQVTTMSWAPTYGNAEHRRAVAQLPPVHAPRVPIIPKPPLTSRISPTNVDGDDTIVTASTARARLNTADRIKKRTNKLQQEILELNQRDRIKKRTNKLQQEILELNQRHEARNLVRIASSPRRPAQYVSPRQTVQQVPASPETPKRSSQGPSGAQLPPLQPERVSLASFPVKQQKKR
ncbi:Hypothetical protein, putative [Bodo saltans]|uniref:Uncharacterized protein n=1 Tax=Bodo saltans TaxID=75058 RepID=A0A0S4IXV0_BODSA|nr:Hypothetical protein, putative [Bodo saltans]|eukprot:CUG06473.1 Hypothetical protein, putative [Bodo saltans]